MNREFWRGRSVFVTGHTGFKGGWLSLWLQRLGTRLHGYALPPTELPSLFREARVGDGMASTIGDVRDLGRLTETMRGAAPEVVFHLAAQPIVRTSYEEPVETFSTNVMGTCHLLEAVRQTPSVGAVVVVTSDKCYENTERREAYTEDDPMGGHDPYSSSKGCAELVTSAYRRSFFGGSLAAGEHVAVASARAGNVIGGGDWADHRLIPDAVRAVRAGEPVIIRSPHAVRPWQHVLNPLSGYLLLAERLWEGGRTFAEGWNFGPDDEDCRPVSWLIERFVRCWDEGASWEVRGGDGPHEAGFLKLDWEKARRELGWRPVVGLEQAVEWLVEWYREHAAAGELRRLIFDRIERVEDELGEVPSPAPAAAVEALT